MPMTEPETAEPRSAPGGRRPDRRRPVGRPGTTTRREQHPGLRGRIVRLWRLLPPAGKLGAAHPGDCLSRSSGSASGNLFNYGIFILIYALLALGLNVVVGFAGLLDLGYVAFFGFGAYIYAFLSGTHSEKGHTYTHHWDAQWSIPIVRRDLRSARALPRLVVEAAARRLPRDRHALLRPGLRRVHERRPIPYGITNGSNGLANVDPLDVLRRARRRSTRRRGYYWFLLGVVALAAVVLHFLSESRTGRRLEVVARGSARRGADGHARSTG